MSEYYKDEDMDKLNLSTEEATQFHYFKLHDTDNNNKLDGLELYAAIDHFSEHQDNVEKPIVLEHPQIVLVVDRVLEEDDLNEDGFIDYFEFIKAQENMKKMEENQST